MVKKTPPWKCKKCGKPKRFTFWATKRVPRRVRVKVTFPAWCDCKDSKKKKQYGKNDMVNNNPMKKHKIAKKSSANRLKNKDIWIPKISKALKGNKNPLGCVRSEKTKKILSMQKIGNDYGKYVKWTKSRKKQNSESNKIASEKLIKEGKHALQTQPRITYSENKFAKMHPYLQRQFGIKRWLADFYDKKTNTVIEIDGSMHYKKERIKHDKFRDKTMKQMGYNIVRIPAKEVLINNFVEWRNR